MADTVYVFRKDPPVPRTWKAGYARLSKHHPDILLRVQKGETYASVAARYDCTYQAIQNIVRRNGQRSNGLWSKG